MRLSESIKKGIMNVRSGVIMNAFKVNRRRSVLFFEEILAKYIENCEKAGYKKEMEELGQKWSRISMEQFTPDFLRKIPPIVGFALAEKIWKNIGFVEKLTARIDGDMIEMRTKNECITRIIGKNSFIIGLYSGSISSAFRQNMEISYAKQSKEFSIYKFRKCAKPYEKIKAKDKKTYEMLNTSDIGGENIDFRSALKSDIFQLREENRVYFREKSTMIIENTLFHLIGNEKLPIDNVPEISYKFFSGIISKDSSRHEKLKLLKTLLSTMGWGESNIFDDGRKIKITISNPPHGLQTDPENYDFIIKNILGYLWLIRRNMKISWVKVENKKIVAEFL